MLEGVSSPSAIASWEGPDQINDVRVLPALRGQIQAAINFVAIVVIFMHHRFGLTARRWKERSPACKIHGENLNGQDDGALLN